MVLPLLAVTWMSAVLAVTDRRSALFQILFAVFDSLEGFVIVMVHCILRREVGGRGAPVGAAGGAGGLRGSRHSSSGVFWASAEVAGEGFLGGRPRPGGLGMREHVRLGHHVRGPGAASGATRRAVRPSAGGRGRAGPEVPAPGRQQGPGAGVGRRETGISSACPGAARRAKGTCEAHRCERMKGPQTQQRGVAEAELGPRLAEGPGVASSRRRCPGSFRKWGPRGKARSGVASGPRLAPREM